MFSNSQETEEGERCPLLHEHCHLLQIQRINHDLSSTNSTEYLWEISNSIVVQKDLLDNFIAAFPL
jgi:hypothetical protein